MKWLGEFTLGRTSNCAKKYDFAFFYFADSKILLFFAALKSKMVF